MNIVIREVNINDAYALSDIYKYYVDNFPYSFEYVAPSFQSLSLKVLRKPKTLQK
jgi:L-amino acid N-acyltransferase YncA